MESHHMALHRLIEIPVWSKMQLSQIESLMEQELKRLDNLSNGRKMMFPPSNEIASLQQNLNALFLSVRDLSITSGSKYAAMIEALQERYLTLVNHTQAEDSASGQEHNPKDSTESSEPPNKSASVDSSQAHS
jgi:hypothetical protein